MKINFAPNRWIYLGGLILASILAMGAVVTCEFTSWDDVQNCFRPELLQPTLSSLVSLCRTPFMHTYMPFTQLCWWLAAAISKIVHPPEMLAAWMFHSLNLIGHVLSVLVGFAVLKSLAQDRRAAFVGALAFAVHPLQVEPVAWISALNVVLGGLFTLITIWQYVLSASAQSASKRNVHLGLALIAFAIAVLSKATAVAAPAVLLVIDRMILRRDWKKISLSLLPFFLLALACAVWTSRFQTGALVKPVAWPMRPLIALDAVTFYLYKLIVPLWLAIDYGRTPQFVLERPWLFALGAIPIGLAIWLFFMRKRAPLLVAAAIIFLLGLLPILGLLPFDFQQKSTVADRYMYLPMFGVALAIAWLATRYRRVHVLYVLLGIWTLLSMMQVQTWRNSMVLYQQQVAVRPGVSLGHGNLAIELAKVGQYADAEREFVIAETQFPNVEVFHNHAKMLEDSGRYPEAARYYWRAIMQLPERSSNWSNFARTLAASGEPSEAQKAYRKALELDPQNQEAIDALANHPQTNQ
jgi:hypothetical protein